MPDQGAGAEGVTVVALQEVGSRATFNPVIAGIAEYGVQAGARVHEVVAQTGEGFSVAYTPVDHV